MKKISRNQKPETVKATIVESTPPSGVSVGGGMKNVGLNIQVFKADGTLKAEQSGKVVKEV
jgi:hypothetical protein